MGYYLSLPILVVAAALQASLMPQVRINDGQPDLVVLLVLIWSVNASLEEGLVWAFVGGLVEDILSITPLGSSVIVLVVIVFIIEEFRQRLYQINILLLIGLLMGATLLKHVVLLIIMGLMGLGFNLLETIRFILLPTLFYNLILFLPVFLVLRFIQRRLTQNQVNI